MKPWDTETTEVIAWLNSLEGRKWSRGKHKRISSLVTIKEDISVGITEHKLTFLLTGVWIA